MPPPIWQSLLWSAIVAAVLVSLRILLRVFPNDQALVVINGWIAPLLIVGTLVSDFPFAMFLDWITITLVLWPIIWLFIGRR